MVPAFVTVQRDLRGQWHVVRRTFGEVKGKINLRDLSSAIGQESYSDQQTAEAAAAKTAAAAQLLQISYEGAVVTLMPVGDLYVPVVLTAEGDVNPPEDAMAAELGPAMARAAILAQQKRLISVPIRQRRGQ